MWFGSPEVHAITRALEISAIELGESPVLGRDLRIELVPGTTVLVGRNGAGKSAILERLSACAEHVWQPVDTQPDPARFACEVAVRGSVTRFRYECTWKLRTLPSGAPELERLLAGPLIVETCRRLGGAEDYLWQLHDGKLLQSDGTRAELPPERTLLNWVLAHHDFVFSQMAFPLFNLFSTVGSVAPMTPLRDKGSEELIVPYDISAKPRKRGETRSGPRVALLYKIKDWHEESRETYDELVSLGQRIGLFRNLHLKVYRDPEPASKRARDLVSVSVDGVDLGFLSDGTVRALELLCALVEPEMKLILIDEPERAVHPGLLGKLLHEIAAYSSDRQILLSTHSPQVVSWAKPEAIRVVTRTDGATHVRGLGDKTIKHLEQYLHDEDTLGEFVYGGGLDGFEE